MKGSPRLPLPRPLTMTRFAWAQLLTEDNVRVLLQGVDRPDSDRPKDKYTWLGWLLVSSERYMDKHVDECVESLMHEDYNADWEEACEDAVATYHCCVAGSRCAAFDREVQERFLDKDERSKWARDRVDLHWEWQCINDCTKDIDWVAWFLKEHPVSHVKQGDSSWLPVEDIVGFCTSCSEPLDATCLRQRDDAEVPFDQYLCPYCDVIDGNNHENPLFGWHPSLDISVTLDGTTWPPPPDDFEEYLYAARERRRRLRQDASTGHGEGEVQERQPGS